MTQHESDVDTRISSLASGQHLCFSRAQAVEVGASLSLIKRRVRAGRWAVCHPGVYSLAVSPDPWLQRVWAAWLAVGRSCAVSHSTAAAVHRQVGHPRTERLELIAMRSSHPRVQGVVVHQFDDLRPHHVVATLPACPNLPVTTPSRTIVDLAVRASPSRLRAVITDGVAAGRVSLVEVALGARRRGQAGQAGRASAGVLDELAGEPVPSSVAESAFLAVLDDHPFRRPETQVVLPGRGAVTGVVDATYRDAHVIVEVDSRRWHGRFADMARDRARDAEAARSGYLTLRFMYEHIVADPAWVGSHSGCGGRGQVVPSGIVSSSLRRLGTVGSMDELRPLTDPELAARSALIEAWLARQLAENPVVAAVESEPSVGRQRQRRWFLRVRGEQKDMFSIWFTLRQRTLHYETYVMPAPEENHAQFFEHLLRRNLKLYGASFAIGIEDGIFLVGQFPAYALTEDELDRILGTLYAGTEQFFRPALRIGYAGRFGG